MENSQFQKLSVPAIRPLVSSTCYSAFGVECFEFQGQNRSAGDFQDQCKLTSDRLDCLFCFAYFVVFVINYFCFMVHIFQFCYFLLYFIIFRYIHCFANTSSTNPVYVRDFVLILFCYHWFYLL